MRHLLWVIPCFRHFLLFPQTGEALVVPPPGETRVAGRWTTYTVVEQLQGAPGAGVEKNAVLLFDKHLALQYTAELCTTTFPTAKE